jgi:hypothetical protein
MGFTVSIPFEKHVFGTHVLVIPQRRLYDMGFTLLLVPMQLCLKSAHD